MQRKFVIGSQCVNKQSQDFAEHYNRLLPTELCSQGLITMVMILSCRLEMYMGLFSMLLVEGSSQAGFFRHLSNHLFRSRQFWKYIRYEHDQIFKIVRNLMQILEIVRKIEKIFFVSEIIVSN